MEVIRKESMPRHITHALFDFDGTISLVRAGWQEVMVPMMVEELLQTPRHESSEELERIVIAFVDELTGKQTMYQMLRLVEEIKKRGGKARDALEYKREYLQKLEHYIKKRITDLEGEASPEKYAVSGVYEFLKLLQERGIHCYLASGTDEPFVKREAALLRVNNFFDGIWGAQDDYKSFSKRIAVERIIKEQHVDGKVLAIFGDGYVEMEVAKEYDALAVGVASNEKERGSMDAWKRERLIKGGADIVVKDFLNGRELLEKILA